MNNIENVLRYFLFCEYLNPAVLEKIAKISTNENIVFEGKFDEISKKLKENETKFLKLVNQAKNKSKEYEISLTIYG